MCPRDVLVARGVAAERAEIGDWEGENAVHRPECIAYLVSSDDDKPCLVGVAVGLRPNPFWFDDLIPIGSDSNQPSCGRSVLIRMQWVMGFVSQFPPLVVLQQAAGAAVGRCPALLS